MRQRNLLLDKAAGRHKCSMHPSRRDRYPVLAGTLPNVSGQWPYLTVSRLTTASHAVSIEGDVDGCVGSLVNCLRIETMAMRA